MADVGSQLIYEGSSRGRLAEVPAEVDSTPPWPTMMMTMLRVLTMLAMLTMLTMLGRYDADRADDSDNAGKVRC